jgi:hypothetical protein
MEDQIEMEQAFSRGVQKAAPRHPQLLDAPTEAECNVIAHEQQLDPGEVYAVIFEFVRRRNAVTG